MTLDLEHAYVYKHHTDTHMYIYIDMYIHIQTHTERHTQRENKFLKMNIKVSDKDEEMAQ